MEVIYSDSKGSIHIYKKNRNDVCLLEQLKVTSENDYKRLNQLIEIICKNGVIRNRSHYKKYTNYIWGFKTNDYRILHFSIPGRKPQALVLESFFKKCPTKEYKSKLKAAERQRAIILSELVNGRLIER